MTFRSKIVAELRGFRAVWQDWRPFAIASLTLGSAHRAGLADMFVLSPAFLVFAALAGRELVPSRVTKAAI